MNAIPSSLPLRWLLFALCCLALNAAPSFAGEPLQANFMLQVMADRARMVQVSIVAVVFGCALLWWRR